MVDHCVSEVLVCDSFEIALWSTGYMAPFGFDTLLLRSGESSVVRTPSGCEVPLQRQPYRLYAPCCVPSAAEFASGASGGPLALAVCGAAEAATAKTKGPLRVVTEDEAWLLHGALMDAGWRTVFEAFRVRVPAMPRCPESVRSYEVEAQASAGTRDQLHVCRAAHSLGYVGTFLLCALLSWLSLHRCVRG